MFCFKGNPTRLHAGTRLQTSLNVKYSSFLTSINLFVGGVLIRKITHREPGQGLISLPNVLHLLHSLFNEYSERQINTDRTAVKGGEQRKRGKRRTGGEEEMVE